MNDIRKLAVHALLGGSAAIASAQTDFPAVFVANEGNLEGSVTSMRVENDGTLTFLDRIITGARGSLAEPCPGCNTFAIDITPNGRFLATSHAAGDGPEEVNVYEIATDGTLSVAETLTLAQAGLDIAWISDDLLAVPITDLSNGSELRLYAWTDSLLTLLDTASAGDFLTSVAVHPNGQWIYANDSFANTVRVFQTDGSSLALVQTLSIPVFGVALEITPDGRFLYAAGGISAGGHAFAGYAIDPADGTLSALPGSPFNSPGSSPKGFAVSPDSAVLFVSHGSDATIWSFLLDADGIPTATFNTFDVGLQGTLQGMGTLEGLLFACDDSTALDGLAGVYAFSVDAGGGFLPLPGSPTPTQGISPNDVAVWGGVGGCNAADVAEPFGVLDLGDLQAFIAAFLAGDPLADIAEPFGVLDLADVQVFISEFSGGCP